MEQADHWVDFPKESDPDHDHFVRVPRRLRAALPFVTAASDGRPLRLAARSAFRRIVEQEQGDDLADAVSKLLHTLEGYGVEFSSADQISKALDSVLAPLRSPLQVGDRPGAKLIRFLPDGGSIAGVLRSLAPAVALADSPELPLALHGSTTTALFGTGELLAAAGLPEIVVAVDDFGEHLDGAAATHLSAVLRASTGQAWLATRRPGAAEAFRTDEIVRLVRPRPGVSRLHQGSVPHSRLERISSRHLALQILPAMASTTLAVLEGPHDRSALDALARRRFNAQNAPLYSAFRISLIDAGAADRSGGASAVARLASYAARLGFRVVAVLDGDQAGDQATDIALAAADTVIQLPPGHAIELALVSGLSDVVLRTLLKQLADGFGVQLPAGCESSTGKDLKQIACRVIKSSGGLHAQFVELLPRGVLPPIAISLLDAVITAGLGKSNGKVDL